METVDILIAVFAVVAVVGSIAGAALYEPPEGAQTFGVTFAESSEQTGTEEMASDGVTASTGADEAVLMLEHELTDAGVTALGFDVVLSTNRAGGGTLPRAATPVYEAYLVDPQGNELREGDATASGNFVAGASFTLTVPDPYLMTVPDEGTTVQADNLTAAYQQVNETLLSNNTTGTWQVHVHITFPQGSAPAAETITGTSTPKYRRVDVTVSLDLDIGRSAR